VRVCCVHVLCVVPCCVHGTGVLCCCVLCARVTVLGALHVCECVCVHSHRVQKDRKEERTHQLAPLGLCIQLHGDAAGCLQVAQLDSQVKPAAHVRTHMCMCSLLSSMAQLDGLVELAARTHTHAHTQVQFSPLNSPAVWLG